MTTALTKARAARAGKLATRYHLQHPAQPAPGTSGSAAPVSPPQRQGDRGSQDDATAAPLRRWVRYRDLCAAGIISNWPQLLFLIDKQDFPPGKMLSRNVRAWLAADVERWLDDRPPPRDRKADAAPQHEDDKADQREREPA